MADDDDDNINNALVPAEEQDPEAEEEGQDFQLKGKRKLKLHKFVHRSSSGRKKDEQPKVVNAKRLKEAASMDLSDAAQLTMKEIIKRAEAIDRKKQKEEAAKKAANEKGGSRSNAPAKGKSAAPETPSPSVLTPQVQVVDGRIVISQQSLVVSAQASTREDTETYRRVEEDRPKLNYNSYANRTPVERWKTEDTELFYKALQQFGTDFELIQNLFPGRTRRQVKAKFKNEEKLNPVRLADVLGQKVQDQSAHYRAIIEILKAEKGNEEENLLDGLLLPAIRDEAASEKDVATQSSEIQLENSGAKVDDIEAPPNLAIVHVGKQGKNDTKEKERGTAPASEPVGYLPASPPQSEVATMRSTKEISPTPKAPENPLSSYQRKTKTSGNALSRYSKNPTVESPLSMYKKK